MLGGRRRVVSTPRNIRIYMYIYSKGHCVNIRVQKSGKSQDSEQIVFREKFLFFFL